MNLITDFFGTHDAYSFVWYIWHTHEAIRNLNFQKIFFTDLMFYPYGVDLKFDLFFLYSIVSYPVYFFFGPFASYNFIMILTFIFTFWGMYLFLKLLTSNKHAAIIGALMFTFSGYRVQRLMMGHMDLISTQGIGFFLYFGYKYFYKSRRNKYLIGMIATFILQAYTEYRMFLILCFIAGYFFIGEFFREWNRKRLSQFFRLFMKFIVSVVVGILPLIYLYIPVLTYDIRQDQFDMEDIRIRRSVDLTELVVPWTNSAQFLGWLTLALSLWYLLFAVKKYQEKRVVIFWGLFAVFFFLVMLGPSIVYEGRVLLSPPIMPFLMMMKMPVLKFLHVPKRFTVMVFFYLSLVISFAYMHIEKKLVPLLKPIFFSVMAVLVVVQYTAFVPMIFNRAESNRLFETIKNGGKGSVLVIPFGYYDAFARDTKYNQQKTMLYQLFYKKPMLNGYVTFQIGDLYEKFINDSVLQKIIACQEHTDCNEFTDDDKTHLEDKYHLKYIYISESGRYPQMETFFSDNFPKAIKDRVDDNILLVL
jgi:hypothetical protein